MPIIFLFVFCILYSNSCLVQAHTIGSATGDENPDETLSRIAQGMFVGYVNASGSAGGSYSPDLDGGLTPF